MQLGGAKLLPADDVFIKLEIRFGTATGSQVVDLLDPASIDTGWKLEVGKDYYLCAEVKKPIDATHLQLRCRTGRWFLG